ALDAFGGNRRELEGLQALVDYQSYQFEGAKLSLTANVVTTAIREAQLRAQLKATQEILAAEERQIELIQKQFELGAVARLTLTTQRTQVEHTRALLPPLERDLAKTRHQLAVLSGKLPSEATLPEFDLDVIALPQELPVSVPSALTRQRPDVQAADALRALEADARALKAQADATASARETLDLTQRQYQLGGTGIIALLIAQQQFQQERLNLVTAQSARYADTAALFQALGGGWWN